MPVTIKSAREIELMRKAGKILAKVHEDLGKELKPGMTTLEIDKLGEDMIRSFGCEPSFLNYCGYPGSVCVSVNEEVVHGIPSAKKIIKEGDIVNVDCSTIKDGYFSDSSRMFIIGEGSKEVQKFVETVHKSINVGLTQIKPWFRLHDMARELQRYVEDQGYSVVREYGGHGIGLEFHEDPWVSHTVFAGEDMIMPPGMCFTIEPMVNMGKHKITDNAADGWTVRTKDHSLSAQWEIQLVVTETGYEILTW